MKEEVELQLKNYKKYRTFVPISDEEVRKYRVLEDKKNTLDKGYKKILFGEEYTEKWKERITKIVFSDLIPADVKIRSAETNIYGDISEEKDGSVIGWLEKVRTVDQLPGSDGVDEYILHINGDGKICAPADCTYLFSLSRHVEKIEFGDVFDTSQVTSMYGMFCNCANLKELDLSRFDTQNVTSMREMFYGCEGLMNLNLSSFHTENVTDMNKMFAFCHELQELDVNGFDTRNVTDMHGMFQDCKSLKILDVSGFHTYNVTDMASMFSGCSSLGTLDVSGFSTKKVRQAADIANMFSGCWDKSSGMKMLLRSGWYQEALPLIKEDAYLGSNKESRYLLGICLKNGYGTSPSDEEAFKWFETAASLGHGAAYAELGDCYYEGRGTKRNYEKAYECYEAAVARKAGVDKERMKRAEKMGMKGVMKKIRKWF